MTVARGGGPSGSAGPGPCFSRLARGLYEATENFARIEVAARTALFQSLLLGGIDHVVPNPLFPDNAAA